VTTGPTVVAASPANTLSGVPVNARIGVLFGAPRSVSEYSIPAC
jgi:hypothetical protein